MTFLIPIPLHCDNAETRIRIVVVDTGIVESYVKNYLCKSGHADVTGYGLKDVDGHGTNIASIIARSMDSTRQCLVIIKWYHTAEQYSKDTEHDQELYFKRLSNVVLQSYPSFVNMSLYGAKPILSEYRMIKTLLSRGATVVVAAGNKSMNLSKNCNAYPACYKLNNTNFHIVANYSSGIPSTGIQGFSGSNYGGPATDKINGDNVCEGGVCLSGTSQAAALITGQLVRGNNR